MSAPYSWPFCFTTHKICFTKFHSSFAQLSYFPFPLVSFSSFFLCVVVQSEIPSSSSSPPAAPAYPAATTSSRGTVGIGGVDQNDRVENHTNCRDIKIRMWRKTMRMATVGKRCKQWHILERLYMHVGVKLCQDHVENYSIRQSQIEIGSDMGANTNLHVFFLPCEEWL